MKKILTVIALAGSSMFMLSPAQAATGDPVGNCDAVKVNIFRANTPTMGTVTYECDLEMSLPGIFVRGDVTKPVYDLGGVSIDPNDHKW